MAVGSVSGSKSHRANISDDHESSKRRTVVKDGDRKESDDRAVKAQDDDKGRKVDTEA